MKKTKKNNTHKTTNNSMCWCHWSSSQGCLLNNINSITEAGTATARVQSPTCPYNCCAIMPGLRFPCCADRNHSHNGSIASDGHGNHVQQSDIYTNSQQPQAYASGSLDGSQIKREGSVHSNYGYSEGYSGSLDESNGPHVRQRGEGGSHGQVYRCE